MITTSRPPDPPPGGPPATCDAGGGGAGYADHLAAVLAGPEEVGRRLLALEDDAQRRRLLALALQEVDAEALLAALKGEAERYVAIDPNCSLHLADALLYAADLAGRPYHGAVGLMAKADALRYLGRYAESLTFFEGAARAFEAQGDEVGWARTRIGWLVSMQQIGRGQAALRVVERAREVLVRHEAWSRVGGLDLNTAVVCKELGRYDQALRLYDQARQAYASLAPPDEVRIAWTKTGKAGVLTLLGDFPAALVLHEDARDAFVRHGRTVSVLGQELNVASVYAGQGQYTRALRLLDGARETAEGAGLEASAAAAALDAVECYLGLNRNAEALALGQETAERLERAGAATEAAKARFDCALALARQGKTGPALELLQTVADVFGRAGSTAHLAYARLQRASLYLAQGEWPAALGEARQAHAQFTAQGLRVRQAQAEVVLAGALLAAGDGEEARRLARSAMATARQRGAPWLAYEGHHLLARAARAEGALAEALRRSERAIASIERVQGRLAVELRTDFLDDKLPVYQLAIECALGLGQPGRAFAALERCKSQSLVDYLARHRDVRLRGRDPSEQGLLDELARLRKEHNWFYNRLYGLHGGGPLHGSAAGRESRESGVLRNAIRDRERRIERLQERLALRREDDLGGVPQPLARGRRVAPPIVDDQTLLLEYSFSTAGGHVFAVSSAGLTVVPLAVRLGDVRQLLELWQLNLDATAEALGAGEPIDGLRWNADGVLRALYQALLEPVAGQLAGRERLVVVPYGPSHGVPWHALHDGRRYLLEALTVSTCPSSALLRLCAGRPRRAAQSALVLAHSDGGRLPHVLEEARSLTADRTSMCLVEEEATGSALRARAAQYGVVHIAAHGEARLDNPAFAHVKLDDGHLTMADILNLELDGALVVLSACETGRSAVVGGDELVGLSRGFLAAGAVTLLQSLWRVEDGSTAHLMGRFYHLLRYGAAPGAALRQAQLELLASHGAHPYLWAPFQLSGDGHTPVASMPS
ncbi:MAG: CHAT domain-containing protein [Chloroflexota bacterium]|nr:CHAT domain-containing protein [Chloroflexota bacterium]